MFMNVEVGSGDFIFFFIKDKDGNVKKYCLSGDDLDAAISSQYQRNAASECHTGVVSEFSGVVNGYKINNKIIYNTIIKIKNKFDEFKLEMNHKFIGKLVDILELKLSTIKTISETDISINFVDPILSMKDKKDMLNYNLAYTGVYDNKHSRKYGGKPMTDYIDLPLDEGDIDG